MRHGYEVLVKTPETKIATCAFMLIALNNKDKTHTKSHTFLHIKLKCVSIGSYGLFQSTPEKAISKLSSTQMHQS